MKSKLSQQYLVNYDGFGADWISTSSLALMQMCGEAFRLKYIERMAEPKSIRLCTGSATHKARQKNLEQKVKSKTDLDLATVQDVARDTINSDFDTNEIKVETEFEGASKSQARGIAVDKSVLITAADYAAFQVQSFPDAIEESLAVKFDEFTHIVCGTIDNREGNIVKDFKSSKRSKGQNFADTSQALTTYGMLLHANNGIAPIKYVVENVVDLKSGCKTEVCETTRTIDDFQRVINRFAAAIRAIGTGTFIPASSESWKCSAEYCGFFSRCKYGSGK